MLLIRYIDLFNKMPDSHKIQMPQEHYLYYFGASTKKNMLEAQGLTPRILGLERFYDCYDLEFRKHDHVRWTIKYDDNDLSTALAVNDDGSLRFLLHEKYQQPMALIERQEGDSRQLANVRTFNKELETHVLDARNRSTNLVLETLDNNTQLEGTLAKLILTDSLGQHKDVKSKARLKTLKTIEVEDNNEDTNIFNLY